MKHRLPCVGATAVEQVHSIRAELFDRGLGYSLRSKVTSTRSSAEISTKSLLCRFGMTNMCPSDPVDIHEGIRRVVLSHLHTRYVAGHDATDKQ